MIMSDNIIKQILVRIFIIPDPGLVWSIVFGLWDNAGATIFQPNHDRVSNFDKDSILNNAGNSVQQR